jgi:hypothetical protein
MLKPKYFGDEPAPDVRSHATFQHWLKVTYSDDDGSTSIAAQALRAENARRFAVHLARCPRATRTS